MGLLRDDGKRPDGATLLPWEAGRILVWDFTCPNTLACSHLADAVTSAGAVANNAETRKLSKYRNIDAHQYDFIPIAIETLGALGQRAESLLKTIGKRLASASGERRVFCWLMQRISAAVQRGNSACFLEAAEDTSL